MSLNSTPSAERTHIGIFGRRNVGKSSLINAITGQETAVVSDTKGTTTDPVYKAMELLPIGPVVLIDTPGMDDEGSLGELRVKKARQILNKTDFALLVLDAAIGKSKEDELLINLFKEKSIDYIVVYNKSDLAGSYLKCEENEILVSAEKGTNINELKEKIAKLYVKKENNRRIVGDLINPSDFIILVVPIDSSAPKGRLILPQQQTIRDILDTGAVAVVVKENEVSETINKLLKKPKMVITDSQAFEMVSRAVPKDIMLTSFSILFARYKGELELLVKGASTLEALNNGDTILISEGCTHHRQCNDIGTVKLPNWIKKYTGKELNFEFSSGTDFPEKIEKYKLIVHCGGCMLNEREIKYRQKCALDAGVPMTNYGICIAYIHGILKRSLEPFPEILKIMP